MVLAQPAVVLAVLAAVLEEPAVLVEELAAVVADEEVEEVVEEGAEVLLVEAVVVGEADKKGFVGRSEGAEEPVVAVEAGEKEKREGEAERGEREVNVERKRDGR